MPPPSPPNTARVDAGAVVRWPLLALLLPLLPLVVLLLSFLTPRQQQLLFLDGEEPVESQPFELKDDWLGSPYLNLQVDLPPNSNLLLDVDLLNAAGEPVLQLSKEGWREIGTWSEEGESGTYDEGDDAVALALRPQRQGSHRLRLERQELLGAAGETLTDPLRARLTVQNHSVDRPLLLITALVGWLLVRLLWVAVYGDCRLRQRFRCDDERLGQRLLLGGPGLLRLAVKARYEEPDHPPSHSGSRPAQVALELALTDASGRRLLEQRQLLPLRHWEASESEWWTVATTCHFSLAQPTSVRIRLSVPPELAHGGLELEWLELLVEDGVVTPWPVASRPLQPA